MFSITTIHGRSIEPSGRGEVVLVWGQEAVCLARVQITCLGGGEGPDPAQGSQQSKPSGRTAGCEC